MVYYKNNRLQNNNGYDSYGFDYLYGASYFNTGYEYVPSELMMGTSSDEFFLNAQDEKYFMFTPTQTGNYTVECNGFTGVVLRVYNGTRFCRTHIFVVRKRYKIIEERGTFNEICNVSEVWSPLV